MSHDDFWKFATALIVLIQFYLAHMQRAIHRQFNSRMDEFIILVRKESKREGADEERARTTA